MLQIITTNSVDLILLYVYDMYVHYVIFFSFLSPFCCYLCTTGFSGCFISPFEHIQTQRIKCLGSLQIFLFLKEGFILSVLQKQQQLKTLTLSLMFIQVLNKDRIIFSSNIAGKHLVLIALSHG